MLRRSTLIRLEMRSLSEERRSGANRIRNSRMNDLDTRCVNTIRILSAEAVQRANSGHPGMPMGAATMAYVLWTRFLKHNPRNPGWPDRDRFVLSAGHGSMLLYSLLHLTGYNLPMEEIRNFRQWESRTPGHPEHGLTPGVEMTTGPLGQGLAHGVGMAMAERFLAQRFNRPGHTIVDHFTYAIVSDGDLMEGISHEAAALAGHLRLGKLVYLFDDNHITIEGATSLAVSDNVRGRFEAYGWEVFEVDGDDIPALESAITRARGNLAQPSLIAARTHIAHGSPHKQDTAAAHGSPLGEEELRLTKEALGWTASEPFYVPPEVRARMGAAIERGEAAEREWLGRLAAYGAAHAEERTLWDRWQSGSLPEGWDAALLDRDPGSAPMATRVASGRAINLLAGELGNLVGGSADLAPSNNTQIKDQGSFEPEGVKGPNVHFGVREHAMAATVNGMALHGSLRPYAGTFFVFSDYMRPALRLAALMQAPSVFVFTHDSIGLGEDGPTHQPIEHLPALRAIPGLTVIRPADARETFEAWWAALQAHGPVALVLSRQNLPALDRSALLMPGEPAGRERHPRPAGREGVRNQDDLGGPSIPVARGAYILAEAGVARAPVGGAPPDPSRPDIILISSGSEVQLCVQARQSMEQRGIRTRVVSMPSWELFERQPEAYRHFVLPPGTTRLAVEAASPFGWERYTGCSEAVIGLDRFGASAPAGILFERLGFTPGAVEQKAVALLDRVPGAAPAGPAGAPRTPRSAPTGPAGAPRTPRSARKAPGHLNE
jgi:transketolase